MLPVPMTARSGLSGLPALGDGLRNSVYSRGTNLHTRGSSQAIEPDFHRTDATSGGVTSPRILKSNLINGAQHNNFLAATPEENMDLSFSPARRKAGTTNNSSFGIKAEQNRRLQLERDPTFNNEISQAIDNLKRMPQFKNRVWDRVTRIHQRIEEDRGGVGLAAGAIFKQRLHDKQKREAAEEAKCLD